MNDIKERVARGLLAIGAVFLRPEEPFTWASGIKSPIYCDNRLILTAPDVRNEVEAAIAETVRREFPEAEVLGAVSIITYGMEKGKQRLAEANVRAVSLTDFDEIVAVAEAEGYIPAHTVPGLMAFRANPSDESWMGGKK